MNDRKTIVKREVSGQSLDDLLRDYEGFLLIDKHDLDTAIAEQASLFYQVGEKTSEALSIRDDLKKRMDETYADVTLAVREEAKTAGIKMTEDTVKQEALLDGDYQEAQSRYFKAKAAADKWQNLKDSFIQRGYMLRHMTDLWISGYFSEFAAKVGSDAQQAAVEISRSKLAEKRQELADTRRSRS